jgi:pimeloyl-ACP methyl ester carboxylesterase
MKRHVLCLVTVSTVCAAGTFIRAQGPQMVSVDGHRIRVQTGGLQHAAIGSPTVVLESGAGAPLESWMRVFPEVAEFAAVVAYDRPGNPNGQSERDGQLPTPRHISARLHSLLGQLGLKPPYVLVGHSWGGPLIRMFVAAYPKEVAGLVYVDPTDLRTTESGRAYLRAQGYSDEALAQQRRAREQRTAAAASVNEPSDAESTAIQMLGEGDYAEFRTLLQVPDIPISLLMSAKFEPAVWAGRPCQPTTCDEHYVRFRTEWLKEYVKGVTDSTFTIATNSGHRMQLEDPEMVVWAIQRVVAAALRK